jgi:7-keto-8-aminopelargonate synthetase-like enzyme
LDEGIYVIVVFFPVVPKEKACICVQMGTAQTCAHLEKAIAVFKKEGKKKGGGI